MFLPKAIYEFVPEAYTIASIVAMVVYPTLVVIFCSMTTTLVSLMIWRARKNYRFKADEEIQIDEHETEKDLPHGS